MTTPGVRRKIYVACLAMLLALIAVILVRSDSKRELEAGIQASNAVDQSEPLGRINEGEASQARRSLIGAPSRDGLTEVMWVEMLFRATRRNGVWLPITSGFQDEGDGDLNSEDAETPLYITTGTLPFGQVGEEYLVSMDAVGGQQPYRWSVESGSLPEPLALDPVTGMIAGTAEEPESGRFRIRVTGAAGQSDVAEYLLAIEPAVRLELVTEFLPAAYTGEPFAAFIEAVGGMPPYQWSVQAEFGPFGDLEIDSQTGLIHGSVLPDLEPAAVPLRVVVQDQQVAVEKDLILTINATSATDGDKPLEPDPATISEDEMAPVDSPQVTPSDAGSGEPEAEIAIRSASSGFAASGSSDTDAAPETIGGLSAFLSLRRIGLSWSLPAEIEGVPVRLVRNEFGIPETVESGFVVYEGDSSTVVDDNLNPGNYYYALFVAGVVESVADVAVTLPRADAAYPFGTSAADVNLLHPAAFQAERLPEIVTGPPKGAGLEYGSADVVSLGAATNDDGGVTAPYGGVLTVEFANEQIWDGPGADFTVFENVFYLKDSSGVLDPGTRFMEPAVVAVSQDGIAFRQFSFDFSPRYHADTGELNLRHPFAYHRGFAGINPVLSNGSFPDPTDPRVSGGDSFDIGELGFEWVRFVRIQSIGDGWLVDSSGDVVPHNREAGAAMRVFKSSGFDLDAVAAIWHRKIESQ